MNLGWILRWWDGRRCRRRWWWGERRWLRWREGASTLDVLLERSATSDELLVSWREGDGRPVGPYRLRAGSVPLLIGATGRVEVTPIRPLWLASLALLVGVWFVWPLVELPGSDTVAEGPTAWRSATEAGVTPPVVPSLSNLELRARARAAERAAYYRPGALAESVALWEQLAARGGPEGTTAAVHARRLAHELATRLAALEGAVRWAERTRRWRTAHRLAARMRLEAPPGTAPHHWAEQRLGSKRPEATW